MRLSKIRIQNFRSFQDQTIHLGDYTCLVGPNGSGKSAVLTALNVFFRNNASTSTDVLTLTEEDFHHRNTKQPVRITLTFDGLSSEAEEDFKAYFRQGQLVLFAEAVWDGEGAEVVQHGSRMVMRAFAPYFEADQQGAKAAQLKQIYVGLRQQFPELPAASTKAAMEQALRAHEEEHPDSCELLPERNELYGFTRGLNRLEKYVQWVYVPAVKDAATEQEEGTKTALGQLLDRTIRSQVDFDAPLSALKEELEQKYAEIIKEQQDELTELQRSIEGRLKSWTTQSARLLLQWWYDPRRSITISGPNARVSLGEEAFIGEVPRVGHGMQRAFLLAILQELASRAAEAQPTLLLGFEEPELYQHPPQAQHIAHLLSALASEQSKRTQVLVTTHSPYFVSAKAFESVRMVRKPSKSGTTVVSQATYKRVETAVSAALGETPGEPTELMASVEQILQPTQRELFFASAPVLVEGTEDVAYMATHMQLFGKWADFRRLGCHFVVAGGKKNMSRLLAIANELAIPAFVVFDADTNLKKGDDIEASKKDNACLLRLAGARGFDPWPAATYCSTNVVMWSPKIAKVIRDDFGAEIWDEAQRQARAANDLVGVRPKNPLVVTATLEELHKRGKRSTFLENLSDSILEFAAKAGDR